MLKGILFNRLLPAQARRVRVVPPCWHRATIVSKFAVALPMAAHVRNCRLRWPAGRFPCRSVPELPIPFRPHAPVAGPAPAARVRASARSERDAANHLPRARNRTHPGARGGCPSALVGPGRLVLESAVVSWLSRRESRPSFCALDGRPCLIQSEGRGRVSANPVLFWREANVSACWAVSMASANRPASA